MRSKGLRIITLWVSALLCYTQVQAGCEEGQGGDYAPFDGSSCYGDSGMCCDVNPCCCDVNPCCDRYWVDAEYLYWRLKNSPEHVPLVIESPPGVTPILGEPGTCVAIGHKRIHNRWRSGGRFALGGWIDECCCYGAEVNYFFLPRQCHCCRVCSDGEPDSDALSAPFFNTVTGQEDSVPIAVPGEFSGNAHRRLSNRMQGAELNLLANLSCDCEFELIGLVGFRYWDFYESLKFRTSRELLSVEDVHRTRDTFRTENNFYSGQIGVIGTYCFGDFYATVKGKVAVGAMCERTKIRGRFHTNDFDNFGAVQEFPGGIFALPSNRRHHRKTRCAVLPEANVNVGYNYSDCIRFLVGYTFIYVSDVLWAGKQISRRIDPTQAPSLTNNPESTFTDQKHPRARHRREELWVHGVNAGIEVRF